MNKVNVRFHSFLGPLTSQSAESYTAAHKVIKGDPAAYAVTLHDAVHGLRAQIVTCRGKNTHTVKQIMLSSNTERLK